MKDKKTGKERRHNLIHMGDMISVNGYGIKYDCMECTDGETLTGWCRKRLAPYKIPHYIEFRDMLPKSKVGKLLRREIRDEEKRKETQ